jgi:NTP pyrophosphatase (non-canonical NTP hydrolase)
MKKIIEDNYNSIVERGLITPSTTVADFIDKLDEEISELKDACLDGYWEDICEELADVILTALNFAEHFDIDIKTELNNKIQKNYERAELKRMGDTNSTI